MQRWWLILGIAAASLLVVAAVGLTTALDDEGEPGTVGLSVAEDPSPEPQPPTFHVLTRLEAGLGPMGALRAAVDDRQYEALWSAVGRGQPAPTVDFEDDVVVSITIPDDACPPTLDHFDLDGDVYTPVFEDTGTCIQPLIPKTFVVALGRAALPSPFILRLPADTTYGFDEQRLRVDLTSASTREHERSATADLDVDTIPNDGLVVIDGDQLIVTDDDGHVLGRGAANGFYDNNRGRPVVLEQQGRQVTLRTSTPVPTTNGSIPADCIAADADGQRPPPPVVVRCGGDEWHTRRIEVIVHAPETRRTLIDAPPKRSESTGEVLGHWASVQVSPDGTWVLAMWSGECESPTTFLFPVDGRPGSTIDGQPIGRWSDAPETTPAGWTSDGRARFVAGRGACGNGLPRPGVYAVQPGRNDRRPELLYEAAADFPSAYAWHRISAEDPPTASGR